MTTLGKLDFNEKPYIVIWETTQACDLACVYCPACAQPQRNPFTQGMAGVNVALVLNTASLPRISGRS